VLLGGVRIKDIRLYSIGHISPGVRSYQGEGQGGASVSRFCQYSCHFSVDSSRTITSASHSHSDQSYTIWGAKV
jgi:hypothetical protein